MVCQQLQHWLQAAHRLVEEWILVEANSIDAARLRAGLAVGLTAQQARREMIAYRLPKMD